MNIDEIIAECASESVKEEVKQVTTNTAPKAKVAQKPVQPVKEEKKNIGEALKWAAVFGGLFALVMYWRYTGQMAESAAVPSLCATAALFGYGIGKHGGK